MDNSASDSHTYQRDSRAPDGVTAHDAVFGRTVVPVPNLNKEPKKDKLGFEYAEHCFIGDAITLTVYDGDNKSHTVAASDYQFTLENGLKLTYGQINGLAGDFYGTYYPISDGTSDVDCEFRFAHALNSLRSIDPRQPAEATAILGVLQAEVDAVNEALKNHEDPSVVYSKLPDVSLKLEQLTIGRTEIPDYLGLAKINWDHFGADARTAYNTGHEMALKLAKSSRAWLDAYVVNAFADHFLEDSFSAGHLRTPRRQLHKSLDITADACAKFMHDEDNAIGLNVQNPGGDTWTIYGDKRALDAVDADNLKRCVAAVQASADEVWNAFWTGNVPDPSEYKAWTFAPTLESARGSQVLATLFTFELGRRQNITKRREWQFTTNWSFWSTALACKTSGWWNYPITIDGPKAALTYTAIASTVVGAGDIHVFYQDPSGGVMESAFVDGSWQAKGPLFLAAKWTPLSVVHWNEGKEMRIYSISSEYMLQEHAYSSEKMEWSKGSLGELKIEVAPNSSLAACQWAGGEGQSFMRLYYQDFDTADIRELSCTDVGDEKPSWVKGATLPTALRRSSLFATAALVEWPGLELRVYYQDDDLYLREHCFSDSHWSAGTFDPGQVAGCSPFSMASFAGADDHISTLAYWCLPSAEMIRAELDRDADSWQPAASVVKDMAPGTQFAVAHWTADGEVNMRVFYQDAKGSIVELRSDDGLKWADGAIIVDAQPTDQVVRGAEGAGIARGTRLCVIA